MFHYGKMITLITLLLFCTSVLSKSCVVIGDVPNPAPLPDPTAPERFTISFDTDVKVNSEQGKPIVIEVIRSWAPLGADRLYSLMKDGFFNGAAFFRVVPDFVLQFGISGVPAETSKWNTTIIDDPVVMSNTNWTVSYATAGPDTRTTQLFINYIDNSRLDASGFAPFGRVISGFETALSVVNPTPDSSDGIDQDLYSTLGETVLFTLLFIYQLNRWKRCLLLPVDLSAYPYCIVV